MVVVEELNWVGAGTFYGVGDLASSPLPLLCLLFPTVLCCHQFDRAITQRWARHPIKRKRWKISNGWQRHQTKWLTKISDEMVDKSCQKKYSLCSLLSIFPPFYSTANSSVWIIYGRGSVKSGQDGWTWSWLSEAGVTRIYLAKLHRDWQPLLNVHPG